MLKKIAVILLSLCVAMYVVGATPATAATKKPTPKKVKKVTTVKSKPKVSSKTKSKKTVVKKAVNVPIGVSIKVLPGRTGVSVTFSSLSNAKNIAYVLSYQTDGEYEGALGNVAVGKSKSIGRQLLFGTCSSGVCRYHSNITNAGLDVTVTLKNGKQAYGHYPIRL